MRGRLAPAARLWQAGIGLAVCLAGISPVLLGRTITVDDSGGAEFMSIQAAINAAVAGDVVSVAAGIYRENLLLKNGVSVIGAGRDVTTVDGGRASSVATLVNCDATTLLQGFRLTNGLAENGGGVIVFRGAPIITLNLVTGNSAVPSGFFYGYGGGLSLTETNATVSANEISFNDAYFGGGIDILDGSPTILRNQLTSNTSVLGGALSLSALSGRNATISANTVSANHSETGGGFYLEDAGSPLITNNLMIGNTATSTDPKYPAYGGGIDANSSNARVVNNTFASNVADYGGAVSFTNPVGGSPRSANNIVYGNQARLDGGGAYISSSGITFHYNILDQNFASGSLDNCGGDSSTACTGEPTNFFVNPGLVAPASGDYRLRSGSPAIDRGTDVGAPFSDLRGQRRPLDEDGDGIAEFDRGAYEFDRNDVLGLRFSMPNQLTWDAIPSATSYHMYSGALTTLRTGGLDTCRDGDDANLTDRMFTELRSPGPSSGWGYVVTAVVSAVQGSAGFDSLGFERPLPLPCP